MLLLALAGCIALPFATPPAEVSISHGFTQGPAPPPDTWGSIGSNRETDLRAGIYPLGVVPDLLERRVDPGIGYVATWGPQGAFNQGVYAELRAHGWQQRSEGRRLPFVLRLAPGGTFEVLRNGSVGWGFGASLGVSFEFAQWVDGSLADVGSSGGVIGVGYGEVGFGGGLEASFRHVPGYTWVGLGLRFRLRTPASAGVLLVPIR